MLSRRIASQVKRSLRTVARAASTSIPAGKPSVPEKKTEDSTPTAWQAPNFPSTWSTSQAPRPQAGSSPRFEQTNMDFQPQPLSAMELIAQEPIRLVKGRKAVCDGGGPLGHPKVYINIDQPGPRACGYCGIRFEQEPHHHH
ncbi:NADH:ubiquinone oxidoreductase kDa subunit [Coprinopsis marcescibilis]|uniref:NADH:ubiquinone oxidoreductase kDa subunit n=1 Tax=Coprinopsis marcescibilis TaxID=230819 RepID=A0A5C3LEU2_COPMA|nr:NADH:ubiquinone oxidoreductase kDa subunit [Coprinopsis marcescibilis]